MWIDAFVWQLAETRDYGSEIQKDFINPQSRVEHFLW